MTHDSKRDSVSNHLPKILASGSENEFMSVEFCVCDFKHDVVSHVGRGGRGATRVAEERAKVGRHFARRQIDNLSHAWKGIRDERRKSKGKVATWKT